MLSEQAGAFNELGPWVHSVNPFDIAQQADALHEALTAPEEQRTARATAVREHVSTHDVRAWMAEQLSHIRGMRGTTASGGGV